MRLLPLLLLSGCFFISDAERLAHDPAPDADADTDADTDADADADTDADTDATPTGGLVEVTTTLQIVAAPAGVIGIEAAGEGLLVLHTESDEPSTIHATDPSGVVEQSFTGLPFSAAPLPGDALAAVALTGTPMFFTVEPAGALLSLQVLEYTHDWQQPEILAPLKISYIAEPEEVRAKLPEDERLWWLGEAPGSHLTSLRIDGMESIPYPHTDAPSALPAADGARDAGLVWSSAFGGEVVGQSAGTGSDAKPALVLGYPEERSTLTAPTTPISTCPGHVLTSEYGGNPQGLGPPWTYLGRTSATETELLWLEAAALVGYTHVTIHLWSETLGMGGVSATVRSPCTELPSEQKVSSGDTVELGPTGLWIEVTGTSSVTPDTFYVLELDPS